jgi:hypothetical protein
MSEVNGNVLNLSMEVVEISEGDADQPWVCFVWRLTTDIVTRLKYLGKIAEQEGITVCTNEFPMVPDEMPNEVFNPQVKIAANGIVSVETTHRVKHMWPVTVTNRHGFTVDALVACFESACDERGMTHLNKSKEGLLLSDEVPYILVYNDWEVQDKLSLFDHLAMLWRAESSPEDNIARYNEQCGERLNPKLFKPALD